MWSQGLIRACDVFSKQALHNAHSVFLDATKSQSEAAPCKIQSFRLQFLNMEMRTYTQFKLSFYSTRDPLHEHMAYAIRLCLFSRALRPSGTSEVYYHPKKGARIQTTCWAWCLARANSQNMPRNCLGEAWADCPGTNHSRDCSNNSTVQTMELVPGSVFWHCNFQYKQSLQVQ